MRYVPGLIPKEHRVLPDYFKGNPYAIAARNPLWTVLLYAGAVLFFIAALASILHPLLFLIFGLAGFTLLPPGHRLIESWLRFRFAAKVKAVFAGVLLLAALPLVVHYGKADGAALRMRQVAEQIKQQEEALAATENQRRHDSLELYLRKGNEQAAVGGPEQALLHLERSLLFATSVEDRQRVEQARADISTQQTLRLVKSGAYKKALPELESLVSADPGNAELLYNRALCYSKTGKKAEAVRDLKIAMAKEHPEAEKLYEKVNPVRRKVVGYVTRCCDGTTSYARGRGACSWHGGVCDWNDPVYQEYREFE